MEIFYLKLRDFYSHIIVASGFSLSFSSPDRLYHYNESSWHICSIPTLYRCTVYISSGFFLLFVVFPPEQKMLFSQHIYLASSGTPCLLLPILTTHYMLFCIEIPNNSIYNPSIVIFYTHHNLNNKMGYY